MTGVFNFEAPLPGGGVQPLADWRGDVLLIVNVASECGFTPQYAGLQTLHDRYAAQGLRVLGFPCNQFGGQEPGDADQIRACGLNYGVTFPVFARIEVNGAGAHPLYRYLKEQAPGALGTRAIKWNFTKFLVGRDGAVLERFAPQRKPQDLAGAIEQALAAVCPDDAR
ncbi:MULTISPECIES: glutathione peroxidase [unclassified Thioalkalivibrio]|uniref:glutathione peroxidase n=1 Tax=unclassified Thioalkalivibrio TaxID=2621013 RepID=UPI0003805FA7|nr:MULTISPECIES: glutathione peroxidase [unclassified Thioalkalivibrio]